MKPHIKKIAFDKTPDVLFEHFRNECYCFFLDSSANYATHPDKSICRYSFIGSRPFLVFTSRGRNIEIFYEKNGAYAPEKRIGDPFDELKKKLSLYRLERIEGLPDFLGGAVGYFSYDLGRRIERIPDDALDDLQLPECWFGFYDTVILYDHMTGDYFISISPFSADGDALIEKRFNDLEERIKRAPQPAKKNEKKRYEKIRIQSNFTKETYIRAIGKAKRSIYDGDIYQVNLSQRFEAPLTADSYDVYKKLRALNPAPFSCFLRCGDTSIASSSPERFLRFHEKRLETRPIKGTRPRGNTKLNDEALAAELLGSEKDRAENVMIVDLERNDLGKICEYGSVCVERLAALEIYATVFHLVSTIRGTAKKDAGAVDCVKACFPGGSITGAPKIRSMEIIEELEPVKRGVYTGSIGYISFTGDMDINIAIRTFIIDERKKKMYFQAGGGIVADSDPRAEYEETFHKARALFDVLRYVS